MIPGPFHVLNLSGERKGRYHCLVCRNALNPVAVVFIRPRPAEEDMDMPLSTWVKNLEPGQPLAELLRGLDGVVFRNQDAHMGTFAVFLTREEFEYAIQHKAAALPESLRLKEMVQTVAEDPGLPAEPDRDERPLAAWNLDAQADVTVLLYARHRIEKKFVFGQDHPLTEKDAAEVVAAFEKLVPPFARKFERSRPRNID